MKYAKWMFAMALLLLPGLASAQSNASDRIVTQVPFNFIVADRLVPAGQWSVQANSDNAMTLTIHNSEAKVGAILPALLGETKEASANNALVFTHYGHQYFLTAIKLAGDRRIYLVPQSKAEKEMRAQSAPATTEVLLASLQ